VLRHWHSFTLFAEFAEYKHGTGNGQIGLLIADPFFIVKEGSLKKYNIKGYETGIGL